MSVELRATRHTQQQRRDPDAGSQPISKGGWSQSQRTHQWEEGSRAAEIIAFFLEVFICFLLLCPSAGCRL
ncbi:unnamed protein product [Linum trigynum]|uniref:Uncharacterized protein n=1 Tax=Linum trigynum TaxID=586398 RepID=A0AAV2CGW8_9ROSI